MQKTKMIFTIGPSSDSEEVLTQFIQIGMNVARLNFSHGTQETHKEKINLIKKIRTKLNTPTAIMLDIKCNKEILGNNKECSISYSELYKDVHIGGTILVDDGLIAFKIIDINRSDIICKVLNDGIIKNHKGVNVPNVSINLPSVTDKDKCDLIFGCKMGVDFVAASFIRKSSDIKEVREILNSHNGNNIQIIAKIENQEGVNNIDSILQEADGIMVARGDMGVEIPIEKVPIIQKKIIRKCNESGKIVITATQMLDSMIRNSLPTRAEACDICNAIFDGTDAIMLSGESASGQYPIEAAKTMSKIAKETELHLDYNYLNQCLKEPAMYDFAEAISYSTCRTSNVLNAKAIVAATNSGSTAKLVSKYKPKCPIVAITPHEEVLRGLSLNFGVYPVLCQEFANTDDILNESKKIVTKMNLANKGDDIIVAAGMPTNYTGGTNMLKIEKI